MANYKYTVKFQIETDSRFVNRNLNETEILEMEIKDLLQVAVLPTLNLELVPLTFEVKRSRR